MFLTRDSCLIRALFTLIDFNQPWIVLFFLLSHESRLCNIPVMSRIPSTYIMIQIFKINVFPMNELTVARMNELRKYLIQVSINSISKS